MMKSILPNSRKPDISFHPSGKIDISARIARQLSLASGDVIDIAYDAGELYLYVRLRAGRYIGRHEGRVWGTTVHKKGTFRTYSKTLVEAALSAAGTSGPLRCPCGEVIEHNHRPYITIIYRCPL